MSIPAFRILIALLSALACFLLGSLWQRQSFFTTLDAALAARPWRKPADDGWTNNFLTLAPRTIEVGTALGLNGDRGGILARGDDVLGVTGTGEFFLYEGGAGPSALSRLDIRIESHRDAFLAHVGTKGFDVQHSAKSFRFIDLALAEIGGTTWLFVTHHHWDMRGECVTIRVSKLPVRGPLRGLSARTKDWSTLFETRPCLKLMEARRYYAGHQDGGRMAFDHEKRLLLTVGDFEFDGFNGPVNLPQDADADYGKILRIDPRTGAREILSIGHRNPQGLLIDREGNIWTTEHGPQGGDELNLIRKGANYGWPYATYGVHYGTSEWPLARSQGRHKGFELPVWSWTPSIGVSNLIRIRDFAPAWDGDLLVASLSAGTLFRMRYRNGRILFAEPIRVGTRIRDIDQLRNGTIVLWTDRADIVEVRPGVPRASPALAARREFLAALEAPLRDTVAGVIDSCAQCHSLDPNRSSAHAPGLWGVYGRPIAGSAFPRYSRALRSRTGKWDERTLMAFLADPEAFAPGNAMAGAGIQDPGVRKAVVAWLKKLQGQPGSPERPPKRPPAGTEGDRM